MWPIIGAVVAVALLLGGAILYVKSNAASAVETKQAQAILADEKAKRAAEEKERVATEAREDEEFNAKANAVRTADDAADFLREVRTDFDTN